MFKEWKERRAERRHTRLRLLRAEWRAYALIHDVDITDPNAIRKALAEFIIENQVTKRDAIDMINLGATR